MNQPSRLHSLQYLRAIAAILVVYSHAVQQHEAYKVWLPYYGDVGVDVFFIISGFILVWIARDTDTAWLFFVRRIRRIVPLYWFFTLLMASLVVLVPTLFRGTDFDVVALLKSLLFIPYWSSSYPDKLWPLLVPGWSLNYEMYFYFVFAIALWLPSQLRIFATSLVIVLGFVIANLAPEGSAWQDFMKQSIVLEFVLGMLLALSYRYYLPLSKLSGVCLIVLGIFLLVLQPLIFEVPLPRVLEFGVPALFIVAGMLYLSPGSNRLGLVLGDSSYALYLSHGLVLGAVRVVLPVNPDGGGLAAWFYVVTAIITCVIAGVFVHWSVDGWLLKRERWLFLLNLVWKPRSGAALHNGAPSKPFKGLPE